jgi:hypothetical protein
MCVRTRVPWYTCTRTMVRAHVVHTYDVRTNKQNTTNCAQQHHCTYSVRTYVLEYDVRTYVHTQILRGCGCAVDGPRCLRDTLREVSSAFGSPQINAPPHSHLGWCPLVAGPQTDFSRSLLERGVWWWVISLSVYTSTFTFTFIHTYRYHWYARTYHPRPEYEEANKPKNTTVPV